MMKSICLLLCMLLVPCFAGLSAQQGQVPDSSSPAATSPHPPVKLDGPLLHVYRQHRYAGSALAPSIVLDGHRVARVGSGRRVTIRLTAGSHTISSDDKSSSIALDAKAGQEYFIRIDEETGFWKGHGRLTLVVPEQGGPEYKLQKPIEPDRVFAKELIVEE